MNFITEKGKISEFIETIKAHPLNQINLTQMSDEPVLDHVDMLMKTYTADIQCYVCGNMYSKNFDFYKLLCKESNTGYHKSSFHLSLVKHPISVFWLTITPLPPLRFIASVCCVYKKGVVSGKIEANKIDLVRSYLELKNPFN